MLPLLMAVGCDTTEELFWIGEKPSDVLDVSPRDIILSADAVDTVISVYARSKWTPSLSNGIFTIAEYKGGENGFVRITGGSNYAGDNENTARLVVKALDLDEEEIVNIRQMKLTFEMDNTDFAVADEEGSAVRLSFTSTVDWKIESISRGADENDKGDLNWLQFTPGLTGIGKDTRTNVEAVWTPNYTPAEREIKLALSPQKEGIGKVYEFTLTQATGTLPTIFNADTASVDKTSIDYKFEYTSKSPVTECGVNVLSESGEVLKSIVAEPNESGFQLADSVNIRIVDLEEGTIYKVQPYVRNLVGEKIGDETEVMTEVSLVGVKTIELIGDPIISKRGLTVRVMVESDTGVNEIGMDIYDKGCNILMKSIRKNTENKGCIFEDILSSDENLVSNTESFSNKDLNPNTEYEMVFFANTIIKPYYSDRLLFKTKGEYPGEEDNTLPIDNLGQ